MADPRSRAPQPLVDHETVLAAVRRCQLSSVGSADRTGPGAASDAVAEALAALHLVGGLRSHLDEMERLLIEGAREHRVSWARIAAELGLASRQAAEQRWLRLSGDVTRDPALRRATRTRQRSVDELFGGELVTLRSTVHTLHRQLGADPGWDDRHPVAGLARRTLGLAGTAAPPAMFDLVRQVVRDLETMPAAARGTTGEEVLSRLRAALAAATPKDMY